MKSIIEKVFNLLFKGLNKKKPLTKKQVFDLQFKWNYPSKYRTDDNWWNNPKYWIDISINQTLSEDFIREFKYKVDWFCIPIFQDLSKEFIEEMKKEGYIK